MKAEEVGSEYYEDMVCVCVFLVSLHTWYNGGWLVVDAHFKSCRAPVDELNGVSGLDGSDSRIDVFGGDISAIQHATGHIFALLKITFHHLVTRVEAGICNFLNCQLFVVCFLGCKEQTEEEEVASSSPILTTSQQMREHLREQLLPTVMLSEALANW